MKYYLLPAGIEFSRYVPAAVAKHLSGTTLPTAEPTAALHGNGWSLLPLTDTGPTLEPYQQVESRTVQHDGETAWAVYTVEDKPLADYRAERLDALRNAFRSARDSGTTVDFGGGPVAVQTDPQARSDVLSLYDDLSARADAGETNPTQDFATAEYAVVEGCTLAMAEAMKEAVAAHWRAVWANDAALGKAIKAATTAQDVAAVDITQGWPE